MDIGNIFVGTALVVIAVGGLVYRLSALQMIDEVNARLSPEQQRLFQRTPFFHLPFRRMLDYHRSLYPVSVVRRWCLTACYLSYASVLSIGFRIFWPLPLGRFFLVCFCVWGAYCYGLIRIRWPR